MKKLSNNKVFNTKIQEYIRDYRDKDINLIKKEVHSLENGEVHLSLVEACEKWVRGGELACYYSQVAQDLADLFECSVERTWEVFDDDGDKMWEYYVRLMSREVYHLVKGERVYIQW